MPKLTGVFLPGTVGATGSTSQLPSNAIWGSDTQDPNATGVVDQPSASWSDPTITPAAWSYSQQDNANYGSVYTGSTDTSHVSQISTNVLVGQIAQKLGLKPKKGISKEEQVIDALSYQWKVNGDTSKKAAQGGENGLSALLAHATGQNIAPGQNAARIKGIDDPNAWATIAKSLGVTVNDSVKSSTKNMQSWTQVAQNYIATLQNQGQGAISNLQAQLYAGGYYDQPEQLDPSKIKEGNLDSYTVKALGEAIKATAAANKQGQMLTVQQGLTLGAIGAGVDPKATLSQAVSGTGGAAAVNAKTVIQDTQGQLAPSLRQAFEADLGFAPSADQLANFTSQYQSLQQAHASTAANSSGITFLDPNNIPEIQGIASPTQAAGNFAVNNDTTAFLAHGMANAAALLQNAIGSTGPRPLNSDPNLTTAARPI